jgi:membrane protein DedA with SNARE-associated domain
MEMTHAYIYCLIFTSVVLEGEIALVTASMTAQTGIVNIYLVSAVAFIATLVTDWFFFFLGKYAGDKVLHRFESLQKRTHIPMQWLRKKPGFVLFFYRYLYGLRIVSLLIIGMSKISVRKFLWISFLSILFWTILFSLIGFYIGELIAGLLELFENISVYIAISILIAFLLLFIFKQLAKKTAYLFLGDKSKTFKN